MEWEKNKWGEYKERNRYIYEQRKEGRTFKSIAEEIGVTPVRIRDICKKEERRERLRAKQMQTDCAWK